MQRTVNATEISYLDLVEENGKKTPIIAVTRVPYKDKEDAIKKLCKTLEKTVTVMETKRVDILYKLDDDIFFKYAEEVSATYIDPENGENVEPTSVQ